MVSEVSRVATANAGDWRFVDDGPTRGMIVGRVECCGCARPDLRWAVTMQRDRLYCFLCRRCATKLRKGPGRR